MKKLFGHKPKTGKSALGSRDFSEDGLRPPIPTPLYNKHATHGNPMAGPLNQPFAGHHVTDEELWEVVQPTPSSTADSPRIPGVQPPPPPSIKAPPSRSGSFTSLPQSHGTGGISASAAPPRSASPMSTVTNTSNKLVKNHPSVAAAGGGSRKKSQTSAPVAVGILRALEPPRMVPNDPQMMIPRASSEERRSVSDNGEREKKKGFWGSKDKERERERLKEMEREHQMREMAVARERERERETRPQEYERGREQRRDEDSQAELTRMIGKLPTSDVSH
ncbi:hypothetical protein JR316_0010950 [Psilocybe cubensis]|uniref:Uncharacterized protein n=1 Tax=Psilocybe cubensis TaxID=181762 RepID=A0ACB8GPR7_PSICU|nr:hypothetical protein JR316_0010950 [Psilocybe cubensis]KAH9477034.1 hypothetical protein JR316_0010950 [Psilocybe cubensis]